LADMVENRDKGTGGHIERTSGYIKLMVDAMVKHGVYSKETSGWDMEMTISSARLHDVGKIAISDFIVNKPGPLTEEEFAIMKTHAAEGERIIDQIVERTGDVEFLRSAKLFAGYHHERWDGTGYPHKVKEYDIPLQGRIMAIADVYDALVSDRPYKKAFTDDEAYKIIMSSSGKQFDPKLTEIFSQLKDEFRLKRESY
ncbi:MAG: HD domain-containing protein, partial [Treponema sp.]|nr:HD domain-containing protein [Treponema sp.]